MGELTLPDRAARSSRRAHPSRRPIRSRALSLGAGIIVILVPALLPEMRGRMIARGDWIREGEGERVAVVGARKPARLHMFLLLHDEAVADLLPRIVVFGTGRF